jgi:hypothetical protein
MNPRRSPGFVFGHHTEDEFTQFPVQALSSRTLATPGKPGPIEPEASSMPTDKRLGSNEDQGPFPPRPGAPQHNPEESVGIRKTRPWAMSREDQNLLPQSQVFQEKVMT